MTDDWRERLRESEAFLERMQAKDRACARQRLKTAPDTLTAHERELLGDEYYETVRQARRDPMREMVTDALRPKGIVFRTPFLEQLNNHAINLVMQHGIMVRRSEHTGGLAFQEAREIVTPPVTNEPNYAVCLHEIGHVLSPDGDSRQYAYTIEPYACRDTRKALIAAGGEIGAWRWAVDHALAWTIEMQERMLGGLTSYAAGATREERLGMVNLLKDACSRVTDKAWTFAELEEKCAQIRDTSR